MSHGRNFLAAMGTAVALLVSGTPALASGAERVALVREWNEDGSSASAGEVIGWSRLVRSEDGLEATVKARGLIPEGVYTFWWVVPHELPPTIPSDVFVAGGASAVAGPDGKVTVRMRAFLGQTGICGFPPLGGAKWHALTDPLTSLVRVEVAYHGQADAAGDDLATWRGDFWTGSACPVDPGTEQGAAQPHCPVYFAATHMP